VLEELEIRFAHPLFNLGPLESKGEVLAACAHLQHLTLQASCQAVMASMPTTLTWLKLRYLREGYMAYNDPHLPATIKEGLSNLSRFGLPASRRCCYRRRHACRCC